MLAVLLIRPLRGSHEGTLDSRAANCFRHRSRWIL